MTSKKPEEEKVSNVPPFGLRMLPVMKEQIAHAAAANGRSINAEIVARLQRTLDEERLIKAGPVELVPGDYVNRMAEERQKFEDLLRSYQQIFQGFTPANIAQMLTTYEDLRKEIKRTGKIPETNPFKSNDDKS